MITNRVPPCNIEAEESLLSYILNNNDASAVVDILMPEDFYKTAHNKIYNAMYELHHKKEPVELVSIFEFLKSKDELEYCGGAVYVAKLLEDVPITHNPIYTAEIIKACSVGRDIIIKSEEIVKAAYKANRDNITDIIDTCRGTFSNIDFGLNSQTSIPYGKLCNDTIIEIEDLNERGVMPGIQTGYRTLDRLTGGFWGPMLIIIAARPGVGKTSLMLNIAKNMASVGHKVSVFELEMSKEELMRRQLASDTGINLTRLRTGQGLGFDDFVKINYASEGISRLPIMIDDGYLPIGKLKRRIKADVKSGSKIIFIDQLSKIPGAKGDTDYARYTYLVNELSFLKKELNTPIVLLTQINRKSTDNLEKRPTLENLKQTGAIEEDANLVLLGHRKGYYTKKEEDLNHAEWEIAKNRDGPTFNIPMHWDGKTTTFSEIDNNY